MERMRLAALGSEDDSSGGSGTGGSPGDAVEEVRKLRLQKDRLEGLCRVLTAQVKAASQQQPQAMTEGEAPTGGVSGGALEAGASLPSTEAGASADQLGSANE